MNHLKTVLPDRNNHIIFIGYAGENIINAANITELRSFSSHASYEELIEYYTERCRYNKLALVHGNFEDKVEFAHYLQNIISNDGKSARVVAVNQDQKIYF